MESTHGEQEEALRRRRRMLEGSVERWSTLLARICNPPTEGELEGLEQATAVTLEALAELLHAIDRSLAREGGDANQNRLQVEFVCRALGLGDPVSPAPAWQRCVAELYGRLCDRNRALRGVVAFDPTALDESLLPPRPGTAAARWATLVECLTRAAYLGSTHAAGGLAARLAAHPLDLGVLFGPPRDVRRPWERADLDALRALASGLARRCP